MRVIVVVVVVVVAGKIILFALVSFGLDCRLLHTGH